MHAENRNIQKICDDWKIENKINQALTSAESVDFYDTFELFIEIFALQKIKRKSFELRDSYFLR